MPPGLKLDPAHTQLIVAERVESYDEALFAIRNGGFSGAIMPQNIVVGEEDYATTVDMAKAMHAGIAG